MRLTKLELHGFKSFADSTTMVFDSGVTAIVGPNGCGKSNVSDAVRWVLGEQRARALRGAKMDEVIFQGSSARRPVSVAEVSLHFDNDDGGLPVAYREVVVTRRLSRSGESEYLLNRSPCRLRDIHDLLRGTGLGADAGVVIESRMVDALLSDRPDDRRELFEEAAGIGLYRDRRRTTERRLEETSTDLARLDDLLGEVQTQVRSLARQRRRAERHGELTARRFAVDLTLASRELAAAQEALSGLDDAAAVLGDRLPACQNATLAAERRREGAHQARAAAERRRTELARLVTGHQQQVAALQGEIAVAEERQRNASARRQRADDERRDGEAAGGQVLAAHAAAAEEQGQARAAVTAALQELSELTGREDAARRNLALAREDTEQHDRDVREHREAVAHLDIERAGAAREHAEVLERQQALTVERTDLAERESNARRLSAAAAIAAATAAAETARATSHSVARQSEFVHAREAEAQAHQAAALAEATRAGLTGTVDALERLEQERVGLAPAAARLLAERAQFGDGAILGPLSDYLTADTRDAAIVERFLGVTLHAIVVRDRLVAEAVKRWHRVTDPGPLCLLPLDADREVAVAGNSASLAERVTVTPAMHWWAHALLGRVRDLGEGAAFEDASGAIWLPALAAGQGPLQRRAELGTLRRQLAAAQAAADDTAAAARAAHRTLQDAQQGAAAAAEAAATAEHAARRAAEHHAECERRLERNEQESRQAQESSDRLSERAAVLAGRIAALAENRARTDSVLTARRDSASAAGAALSEAERAQERARDARIAAQVALADLQAAARMADERARRLEEEHAATIGRLQSLRTELESLASTDGELARQVAGWRAQSTSERAALADAELRLAAAEAAVVAADTELLAGEHALDQAHHDGAAVAEELHHTQLRRTEVAARQRAVQEKLEVEWNRPWNDLLAQLVPLAIEDSALRAEAADLREQVAALGPVNALAVEEHDEESKRLEFLTTQRADLAAGRASLQQAIREIDETARELFLDTFGRVRENFRRIFMTLFGGESATSASATPTPLSTATSRSTPRRAASAPSAFTCCPAVSGRSSRSPSCSAFS